MRKINFLILAISLVFGGMFFLRTEKVQAACCVSSCSAPTHDGKCAGLESPDSRDCSQISTCSSNTNNTNNATSGGTTFVNPLRFNTIQEVLTSLLVNLRTIVVTLAIIFIVLGGILYITSGGNEKRITTAKACVMGAVIGFAIVLAAPTFLIEVKKILGDTSTTDPAGLSLLQIATNVLNLLLSILGIIAIISMVVGGGMYLTSYGDEKRIDTAKKIVQYSIFGIVVALASLVIVRQIATLIGG